MVWVILYTVHYIRVDIFFNNLDTVGIKRRRILRKILRILMPIKSTINIVKNKFWTLNV
jgi:hypothetical protein